MKALIFDCDGVLVDTEQQKIDAWIQTMKPYGVDLSVEDFRPHIGHCHHKIIDDLQKKFTISVDADFLDKKETAYHAIRKEQGIIVMKRMVNIVKELHQQHGEEFAFAVASSDTKDTILENLKAVGLSEIFSVVVSGHDDLTAYGDEKETNKPAPYVYQETAKQLRVDPVDCVAIEDTQAGVESASGAGMAVIAVPNEFTTHQDFSQSSLVIDAIDSITAQELYEQVKTL